MILRRTRLAAQERAEDPQGVVWLAFATASDCGFEASKLAKHFRWPVNRANAVIRYGKVYSDELATQRADSEALFESLRNN